MKRFITLALCSVSMWPQKATAESPPNLDDIQQALDEDVVTSVTRSAEAASTVPATVSVITAEEIRQFGVRTIDEAVNFLGLGMVTENPLHAVEIGARGVLLTSDFGNHVLLLLNGHMLNEAYDNTAYFERGAGIPIELVDHIEVVIGPGSVLYGSNAMLGVINVVTKQAKDYRGGVVLFEGELSPSIDKSVSRDVGTGWRVGVGMGNEFQLFGRRAEIVGQVEYYRQSGPAFVFGPQAYGNDFVTGLPKQFSSDGSIAGTWGGVARNSYFTEVPAGHVRLTVGDLEVEIRAAEYTRSTPYPNLFNTFFGDFDVPNVEREHFLGIHARHHLSLLETTQLVTRIYGDLYDYLQTVRTSAAEDCQEGQLKGCRRYFPANSAWAGIEPQLVVDWLTNGALVTTLGSDLRVRHVGAHVDVVDRTTGADPGDFGAFARNQGLAAFFLQQQAQPARWLSLNMGVRLDIDPRFGAHLSPRAAAAAQAWQGATFKLIYAEAFRAPSAYELYYADPNAQVPASDLKPEVVRSIEASLQQRFGSHRLQLSVYRSWWRDLVLLQQLSEQEVEAAIARGAVEGSVSSVAQYRNISELENWGADLGLSGAFGRHLRYGASLTAAHTRRLFPDGSSLQLPVAPSVFGNARLALDLGGDAPVLALAASFMASRFADRAFDGGFTPTPKAPAQLELRATISGPVPWFSGMTYRLSLNWAAASRTPYVAGPVQVATPDVPSAELAPIDRLRGTLLLEQRF
jgi:outer membrane receptor for ferrienterochelin and colicins